MKKLRVFSDHIDRDAWTLNCRYFDFTCDDSDIRFYTYNPELSATDSARLKIALIIEPRISPVTEQHLEYILCNHNNFDYIFTHDDELLQLDNARLFNWGGAYCEPTSITKTKNLSIISSYYNQFPQYLERLRLARYIRDTKIGDAYGTFDGGNRVDAITAHAEYRFAVVVENYIEDYWWTEKINNCFLCKTVPIYIGAKKIGNIFNEEGIVIAHNSDEVIDILNDFDFESEYEKRKSAIEENYIISQRFSNAFDNLYLSNLDIWGI